MSKIIEFPIRRAWVEAGEEAIAKRIALVTSGGADRMFKENMGGDDYRWNLDSGNNWWLRFKEVDGKYMAYLAYRYGGGGNEEFIDSLQKVLEWIFKV